jgi:hypothetical protein
MNEKHSLGGLVLVVVVGLAFAGIAGYLVTEQNAAIEASEPIDATVVSSEVVVEVDTDSDGTTRSYYPAITYEYTVDGRTYRSDNVVPGPGRTTKGQGWARDVVADNPAGADVTAYYDPATPARAYLVEARTNLELYAFGGMGVLAVLAGLFGIARRLLGLAWLLS